ncbi:MAG: thiamine pyrophosphate-dependent dehydrogenase E1 component subunit alpha [Chloroflexi bacterium]|nr:thiamine pyrophosphate-dependent dehydrogenase E1 component subunit alpha [Chloroflexota bacterium]
MLKIRCFEEKTLQLYRDGFMQGPTHLYIGQEAVATGVCAALEEGDLIVSTHRPHGHLLAKGADPYRLLAELLGRKDGYSRGKGGSMHNTCLALGVLPSSAIVGGGLPYAVGAALAAKLRGSGQVVVSFFGDGASNQGTFHESLNMAGIWRLPIVFACENNLYGSSTRQDRATLVKDIAQRATSYGIQGKVVDGNDVLGVYGASKAAVAAARQGQGPTLLEFKTYRWYGHSTADPGDTYRTPEEISHWKEKCPIKRFTALLLDKETLSQVEIDRLKQEIQWAIDEASRRALEAPFPVTEEALSDVFSVEK